MSPEQVLLFALIRFAPSVWEEFIALVNPNDFEEKYRVAIQSYKNGNQKLLEELIKSDRSGTPSGLPDAVIVDSLPGVPNLQGPTKLYNDLEK